MLHDYGLKVIVLARSQKKLEALKRDGPSIDTICIDITNFDDVKEKITPIAHNVNYLINNASYYSHRKIDDVNLEDFDAIIKTNVKAVLNMISIIAVGMKERRSGCIVNVAGRGTKTQYGLAFYHISKAAVERIKTHSVNELRRYNIRMIDIDPGVVDSDLTHEYLMTDAYSPERMCIPTKRCSDCDEIVHTIVFLLSDSSKAIDGTTLYVDGGFHAL